MVKEYESHEIDQARRTATARKKGRRHRTGLPAPVINGTTATVTCQYTGDSQY